MDGCWVILWIKLLLLSCVFCSKGDWGGESKGAVEVELFGVVGECCKGLCCVWSEWLL